MNDSALTTTEIADRNRRVVDLLNQGQSEAALAGALEVEKLAVEYLRDSDPERAKAILNSAKLQQGRVSPAETASHMARGVEAMRVAVGEKHPWYGRALSTLASFLIDVGRVESAERISATAITVLADSPLGNESHLATAVWNLAGMHAALAKQEAEGERPTAIEIDEETAALSEAHFERSQQTTGTRRDLENLPAEIREWATQDLDSARRYFGALTTHRQALEIVERHKKRGEPFAILLRGFEGESYSYLVKNPEYLGGGEGTFTFASVSATAGTVERLISQKLPGSIAVLAVASPASIDPSQGAMGASLPRMILPSRDWIQSVRKLIQFAHMIIVDCLSLNEGLRLELQTICDCGKCDNTVVLLHRDRSELDRIVSEARVMADVTGGALVRVDDPEFITKEHEIIKPFRRIGYVEDFGVGDLEKSPLVSDLIQSTALVRSANRLSQAGAKFAESGEWKVAAHSYYAALRITADVPGWAERATTWFNLGTICWSARQWDDAIQAFVASESAAAAIGDSRQRGLALSMRGDALIGAKRPADAVAPLTDSLEPLEEAANNEYLSQSLRLLGQASEALGHNERSAAANQELERLQSTGTWRRADAADKFKALFLARDHSAS